MGSKHQSAHFPKAGSSPSYGSSQGAFARRAEPARGGYEAAPNPYGKTGSSPAPGRTAHRAAPAHTATPYSREDSLRLERAQEARRHLDERGQPGAEGSGYYRRFEQPLAPHIKESPRVAQRSAMRFAPSKLHFWRWFRTLPILALVVAALASASVELGLFGVREYLYPLHYTQELSQLAQEYGVDPLLVASVVRTESNWNPQASSSAGAQGLMQLLPQTAQELADRGLVDTSRYDPNNLLDPETNLAYGTAYLSFCLEHTQSLDQAIAAYNAGIGAAQAWAAQESPFEEAISYPETAGYLERVKESLGGYGDTYPQGIPQESNE